MVEKRKGDDFTDKLDRTLYFFFKEEDNIKERIRLLEKREKDLQERIEGLREVQQLSSKGLLHMGDLLSAIANGNSYLIENSINNLKKMTDKIKKSL
jgi:hypothetical protein